MCASTLKVSCQQYTNLVWSVLSLITVSELSFLKQVFSKNRYSLLFIDNCFKTFVGKLFIKRLQITTFEKKTLFLSFPYLGEISLRTSTKLSKSLKGILNCCKLQMFFKAIKCFLFQRLLTFQFRVRSSIQIYMW